jgi:hypothetical protein
MGIDKGEVVPSRYEPLCDWPEIAEYISICEEKAACQREHYPLQGGVPRHVWEPLVLRQQEIVHAIGRRQAREHTRGRLLIDITLSKDDAAKRSAASDADVEACAAFARHLAADGDFGSAFETLIRTAEVDRQRASELGDTFRRLFDACDNDAMVRDFRRRWSMLLH